MKRIPVSQITAGLVLAREVLDAQGNSLLNEGMPLTELHRDLLLRRGIETVAIKDETDPDTTAESVPEIPEPQDEAAVAATKKRIAEVEQVFADVKDHPLMQELYHLALKYAEQGALRV